MKHVLPWLAGWLVFFWLWQLLTGEWNHQEWIAGASAATIAATVSEIARSLSGIGFGMPTRALAGTGRALLQIFVDFAIVMWAIPRRTRGRVHTRQTDGERHIDQTAAVRAEWRNGATIIGHRTPSVSVRGRRGCRWMLRKLSVRRCTRQLARVPPCVSRRSRSRSLACATSMCISRLTIG